MSETHALTDIQIDLMRILWQAGEASAIQVHGEINKARELAQPTVATMLTRLEKKGVIAHRTEGRQFIYRAVITELDVRRTMLSQLADSLFSGDVPQLIHQLLAERAVSADDLAEVKALIERKEREQNIARQAEAVSDDS